MSIMNEVQMSVMQEARSASAHTAANIMVWYMRVSNLIMIPLMFAVCAVMLGVYRMHPSWWQNWRADWHDTFRPMCYIYTAEGAKRFRADIIDRATRPKWWD